MREVRRVVRNEIDYLVCEICKLPYRLWEITGEKITTIARPDFNHDFVFIHMVRGDKIIDYDICPDCFENKLMPFFESCGAKPEISKTKIINPETLDRMVELWGSIEDDGN